MAKAIRIRAQVKAWLNARVGQKVKDKSNSDLDGQCVALIKALLEYLGVPNPYAARGNARDYGDSLLRQNIAEKGDGFLRVVINRDMGRVYIGGKLYVFGHIWTDVRDYANFEQNGYRALHTTKNTRPYSQRQQVVNLDKWLKADPKPKPKPAPKPSTTTYTVKKNDTMSGIAAKYKLSLATLAKLNPKIKNLNKISVGQKIIVKGSAPKPAATQYYTVKRGDTMSGIARKYKTNLSTLDKLNPQIKNLNQINIGQKVRVK